MLRSRIAIESAAEELEKTTPPAPAEGEGTNPPAGSEQDPAANPPAPATPPPASTTGTPPAEGETGNADAESAAGGEGAGEAAQTEGDQVTAAIADDAVVSEDIDLQLDAADSEGEKAEEIAQECLTAVGVAMALESMGEYLTMAIRNKGLNSAAAVEFKNRAARELSHINQKPVSFTGLESASSPDEAIGAATQAGKDITGYVQRIVTAVRDGLASAIQNVSKRQASVFEVVDALIERGQKLDAALKTKGVTTKIVNSPRIAAGVAIDKAVPERLVEQVQTSWGITKFFNTESTYAGLKTIMAQVAEDNAAEKMLKSLNQMKSTWSGKLKNVGEDGQMSSPVLLGNVIFSAVVPDTLEEMGKVGAKIIKHQASVPGEMRKMEVAEAAAAVRVINSTLAELKKLREDAGLVQMEKSIEELANKAKSIGAVDDGKVKSALAALTRLVAASTALPSSVFTSAYVRQCSAALDWVAASVVAPEGDKDQA